MDEEVRDGEVSLELSRNAAVLDFGLLRKAGAGPSEPRRTRGTQKVASKEVDGGILALGPESQNGNP